MSAVFIVLATWEPPAELLSRQLASLGAQTFTDWTGIVVDDASGEASRRAIAGLVAREPRLRLVEQPYRAGFYRNFERGLALAPDDCAYVALCDQDDQWAPAKLERQVAALKAQPAAQLCYTDMRLADPAGEVTSGSFWRTRPHASRFREILYNNVVTGATALVRRGLLDAALPFPDVPGRAYHDHWLALCAAATGGLAYVDEALVDYTQHAGNVIGAQGLGHAGHGAVARFLGEGTKAWRAQRLPARLDELAAHSAEAEARLHSFAAALVARFRQLPPDVKGALRPFLRPSRRGRVLDLIAPTLLGSFARGEETNLEPLKIAIGEIWEAMRAR